MRLETFFEKFELFASAPNAVGKMRELVLRLAFSGRLSGNNFGNDGLPEGWEARTIDSICASITPGFACSRSHQVADGHIHLRTHNISTLGTLNFDLLVRIDPKMVDPQKSSIRRGDILFNNTNSQELVGKTCLVDQDYDFGFSNHITRLRLQDDVFPGFVAFYLTFLRNSGYFSQLCTRWINQAAVNTDTLKKQTIPLPPLAEQKRIVAKVDELMALCDRLEAQQRERATRHAALARASLARFAAAPTPANLDFLFHNAYAVAPADLRKTILTLAVQGKLVYFDTENRTQTVGDHVEFLNGYAFKSEWFKSEGIRLCRNANVGHGILEWRDTAFVDPKVADEFNRFALSEGDVVLSLDRPLITTGLKVARIRKADLPCLLLQRVAKPIPKHGQLDIQYFLLWLNSPEFVNSIDPGRSNGIPHISTRQVKNLPFVMPPLAEQRRIVAKVDQLMALVDRLETQLSTSRAVAEKVMEAVVAELTASSQPRQTAVSAANRMEPQEYAHAC